MFYLTLPIINAKCECVFVLLSTETGVISFEIATNIIKQLGVSFSLNRDIYS